MVGMMATNIIIYHINSKLLMHLSSNFPYQKSFRPSTQRLTIVFN